MKRIKQIYLFILGLPKTVIFNFKYFTVKDALKLPVFVSHRVWLMELSGIVKLGVVQTGVVKIGYGEVGIFDQHKSRSIWQVSGVVEFKGKASIGHGSKISVAGELIIGNGLCVSAESAIVAANKVVIGNDVLISWDVLIMDTDFHKIFEDGRHINANEPIYIGNKVWIGCRSLILKGNNIADGVIIAAGSTVTQNVEECSVLIAGTPSKVIRHNVSWEN